MKSWLAIFPAIATSVACSSPPNCNDPSVVKNIRAQLIEKIEPSLKNKKIGEYFDISLLKINEEKTLDTKDNVRCEASFGVNLTKKTPSILERLNLDPSYNEKVESAWGEISGVVTPKDFEYLKSQVEASSNKADIPSSDLLADLDNKSKKSASIIAAKRQEELTSDDVRAIFQNQAFNGSSSLSTTINNVYANMTLGRVYTNKKHALNMGIQRAQRPNGYDMKATFYLDKGGIISNKTAFSYGAQGKWVEEIFYFEEAIRAIEK